MNGARRALLAACAAALLLAACGEPARLPVEAGIGPRPQLPPPGGSLIPTVDIAPAKGWSAGRTPTAAAGTQVTAFAEGLSHPRMLYVLPNGDVLVAETNAPERPADGKGLKGWIMRKLLGRAGAAVPSAERITLLRDADGDGVAETKSVFLSGLHSPFGMALVGDTLYVANADALLKVPYRAGATKIDAAPSKVADLPGGPINHHWTKNLIASRDGSKLYVAVGSNSNVAENGIAAEEGRAAVWEFDVASGRGHVFASGLRNPVGMAWKGDTLWVSVNERDELGSDLVPDYMTALRPGAFYGWPWSYYGQHVDVRVDPPAPQMVAKAVAPDYALGPHTASLGLASAEGSRLPAPFVPQGMFVGQHGSWNRKPPSGYKVIYVPFGADGKPSGMPFDVLTGFVGPDGDAFGRPVGLAVDKRGGLLVADDVGNRVWRVSAAAQ
jgi:glucose/arabinose dehydrogenase